MFCKELLVLSPSLWWSSSGMGQPSHSVLPQCSHWFSFRPSRRSLFFHLHVFSSLPWTKSASKGRVLYWCVLFRRIACPRKWDVSKFSSWICFFTVSSFPPEGVRPIFSRTVRIEWEVATASASSPSVYFAVLTWQVSCYQQEAWLGIVIVYRRFSRVWPNSHREFPTLVLKLLKSVASADSAIAPACFASILPYFEMLSRREALSLFIRYLVRQSLIANGR